MVSRVRYGANPERCAPWGTGVWIMATATATVEGIESTRLYRECPEERRDEFLAGGAAELKRREVAAESEGLRRLKSVVADLATDKELLKEKIRHLEASGPLGWWRSKR